MPKAGRDGNHVRGALRTWLAGDTSPHLGRGQVPGARVGPVMVVILPPGAEHLPGMSHAGEDGLVETFVAEPGIEALDEPVLLGLARGDIVPFDQSLL